MEENNLEQKCEQRYYADMGRGHDYLLRCKDCQALVTFVVISKIGSCSKCGNKRFTEITVLSEEEMAGIQSGEISFPDSAAFLDEFKAVEL